MSLLGKTSPAPRKVMTLFYLVDTSGSMAGTRIGTVNAAMEECIPLLKQVAQANDDAEIKVAILQFSNGCSWITPDNGPVNLENIVWRDLNANGMTEFGCALNELNSKLSKDGFMRSSTSAYAPVILLLSDGEPTDDWEVSLEKLKQNLWFKHAIKIAIDIENSSDRSVLAKFTGTPEAILDAKDTNALKSMIHKVSVRASEFQSHSKQTTDTTTTPEADSAAIVAGVTNDVENQQPIDNDDWGKW